MLGTKLVHKETPAILGGVIVSSHYRSQCTTLVTEPSGTIGTTSTLSLGLQQWDVRIEHRKEAHHRVPDALSRLHEQETPEEEVAAFEEVQDP